MELRKGLPGSAVGPKGKEVSEHEFPRGPAASDRLQQRDRGADEEGWPFPLVPFSCLPGGTRSGGIEGKRERTHISQKKRHVLVGGGAGTLTLGADLSLAPEYEKIVSVISLKKLLRQKNADSEKFFNSTS